MVKLCFAFCSILFLLCGCSGANNRPLSIVFSADSSSVLLNHIDPAGLLKLKNEQSRDSVLKSLVNVLEVPGGIDAEFREIPLPGRVLLTDSNVIFIPKHPFEKGKTYLVITHLNVRFGELGEVFKGALNPGIRPKEQQLVR